MPAGCHIEVPREIATKRAVISVRTTDNACFAWSVVAALHPAEEHVYRESSYPHYTAVLNLAGIEFPMILKDIQKFEQLNAMSINVYGIGNKQILPLRLTSDKKEKHINLLYLQDPRDDNVGHFAWIKNLSRLVSSQLSKVKNKKFFCDRCLHYFGSRERLQLHTIDCGKINNCAIRLARFRRAYYGNDCFETLLNVLSFIEEGPFVVIDCSRQNESVKGATVDVRIEFDCKENVPANTTVYCLIIHDRVVQYNPLTNVVRKIT
ncbi:hypothetical protein ALC57_18634 [Trachymyrmex cornetzi]|uniref:Double jelly roll-like domain-containing protein n=1 Tax=Trachymyrmex cornetzi TaxID=471704 RepID=A0A151IRM8_9HYME|nr:hypothetical protein ALC57_18634 [Trachymyrmex cornetzi]